MKVVGKTVKGRAVGVSIPRMRGMTRGQPSSKDKRGIAMRRRVWGWLTTAGVVTAVGAAMLGQSSISLSAAVTS